MNTRILNTFRQNVPTFLENKRKDILSPCHMRNQKMIVKEKRPTIWSPSQLV